MRAVSTRRPGCIALGGALADSLFKARASLRGAVVGVSAMALSAVRSRCEDTMGDASPTEGSPLREAVAAVGALAVVAAIDAVVATEGLEEAVAGCCATLAIIGLAFDATTGVVACGCPAFRPSLVA